jgi:hypothetical protein
MTEILTHGMCKNHPLKDCITMVKSVQMTTSLQNGNTYKQDNQLWLHGWE